ncbi:hypothetical protein D6C90_03380 [Aureobasidium pullulans]|uniref:PAH2 domain-containing protein n=1 Tax=Aureobasidium pullulans TaxID=5580 RepID=A0A4S9VE87_AURPU|nr:hypothetical protein D6C90_03380 [Aureobasidium pullulans]
MSEQQMSTGQEAEAQYSDFQSASAPAYHGSAVPEPEDKTLIGQHSSIESNFDPAMRYLDKIRTRYITRPNVYNQFLEIMKDFYLGKSDVVSTVAQVNLLFEDDEESKQGFEGFKNALGPMSREPAALDPMEQDMRRQLALQTSFIHQQSSQNSNAEFALDYLERVRNKYITQPGVYDELLKILKDFKITDSDTSSTVARVSMLFKEDEESRRGFEAFLP